MLNPETGIPIVEQEEASPEVATLFEEIKTTYQISSVPNFAKAIGASPSVAMHAWFEIKSFMNAITLPESLVSIVQFAVAERNKCEYCKANHELTCRMLGIDEDVLAQVVEDLGNVSPERVRAIVEFGLRVAKEPKSLVFDDYERLRQLGISNDEIIQIALVAARATFNDLLADALKLQVEEEVVEALTR
ncbi:MAG: hypothetical protein IPM16_18410 [Chloroflexi bacterium]|nr:hypothetical protein [Chloroflexota bacterium]